MSKTANKMVKADGQALVESALGEVPLVGTLVSMVNHWRLGRQVDQIERFMQVAEVDKTYLDGLAADDAERELFMEYVSLASNTTSPLVCITLAFIFKDPALGPSIKSLYARSLSGISNGTMNVFMTVMEYLERNRGLYISRETGLPVTENLSFLFNLDSLDFKKELIERQAFISDLVTRNICPQVHLTTLSAPEAGGNNLTISQTSRVIYRYMKQAKAFLNA